MWQRIWSHLLVQHTREAEQSAEQWFNFEIRIYLYQLVKLHSFVHRDYKCNCSSKGPSIRQTAPPKRRKGIALSAMSTGMILHGRGENRHEI